MAEEQAMSEQAKLSQKVIEVFVAEIFVFIFIGSNCDTEHVGSISDENQFGYAAMTRPNQQC